MILKEEIRETSAQVRTPEEQLVVKKSRLLSKRRVIEQCLGVQIGQNLTKKEGEDSRSIAILKGKFYRREVLPNLEHIAEVVSQVVQSFRKTLNFTKIFPSREHERDDKGCLLSL